MCAQFGLAWAYIVGNGSGSICRIKDSAAVLSDDQFLSAAASQMAEKYAAYMEIKLLNKAELIQKLAELRRAQEAETAEGADFYQALDRAAAQLNPPPEEAQDAL